MAIFHDQHGMNGVGVATVIAGVLAAIIAIGLGGQYWQEASKCNQMRQLLNVETSVSISMGCLVKYKGEWMSADTAMTNTRTIEVK